MPAEGRENHLLKKGNSDAFFREKCLTKNKDSCAMPDTGYLDWEKNFFSSMRHCSIPYAKHIRTGWSVSSVSSTTAAAFYLLYHGDAIAPVLIRLSPDQQV